MLRALFARTVSSAEVKTPTWPYLNEKTPEIMPQSALNYSSPPLSNPATSLLNLSRSGRKVVDYHAHDGRPIFLINDPKLAKTVLRNSDSLYFNPPHQYAVLAPLLTKEGSLLLHLSRQQSESVSGGDTLEDLHQRFVKRFSGLDQQLRSYIAAGENAVDITPLLKAYSLQTMAFILFEADISPFAQDFVAAIDYIEIGHLPHNRYLVASMTREKSNKIQRQVASVIARAALVRKEGKEIKLPPHEWDSLVTAVLKTLMNAYNALAISTSWSLRLLAQHPAWQMRLAAEAQGVFNQQMTCAESANALKETRLVVQESLRLYPPAWVLGRYALHSHKLDAMDIPIHSRLSVSPYAMHRLASYWDDPDEFQPDRFGENRKVALKAYFPFGGGSRICTAAKISMALLQYLLANLVRNFHFDTTSYSAPIPYGATSLLPYPHNILHLKLRDKSGESPGSDALEEALDIP